MLPQWECPQVIVKSDETKPPKHLKTKEDIQMWHSQQDHVVEKIGLTVSTLNTVVWREVFRYFKFVDDENDLKTHTHAISHL